MSMPFNGHRIKARELLALNHRSLWDFKHEHQITELECDDGVIENICIGNIIVSSYGWLFQSMFPEVPLLKEHVHVSNYFDPASLSKLLNMGYWQSFDILGRPKSFKREHWSELAYRRINEYYVDISLNASEHVRGACAYDYLELVMHPTFQEIRTYLQTKVVLLPSSFSRMYAKAKKTILNDPSLDDNPLAIGARCGSLKIDQLIQIVVARGFGADVDAYLFKNPVRPGFIDGLTSLEDVLITSRDAAKATFYQKGPTQDSEYLNRRLQLVSAVVKHLYEEDCGSNKYFDYYIDSDETLQDFSGKHYLLPNGTEGTIAEKDSKLIDTLLKVRRIQSCIHPDRYGICLRCFGEIGLNIPWGTNLGMTSSSSALKKFVQILLSQKHVVLSSVTSIKDIADHQIGKWLRSEQQDDEGISNSCLYLREIQIGKKMSITINAKEAHLISDLEQVDDINDLSIARMTKISNLLITLYSDNREEDEIVLLKIGDKDATTSLSMEMLKYILSVGYATDEYGNYIIEMQGWDVEDPFLFVPSTLFSMPLYIAGISKYLTNQSDIENIIMDPNEAVNEEEVAESDRKEVQNFLKKGSAKVGKYRERITNYRYPVDAVNVLYQIVSSKMRVNIAHLEIMVHALTAEDPEDWDFRLPLDRENAHIISYSDAMRYRSMAAMLAHESQEQGLYDISSQLVKHRTDHPYDELFITA